jgi:hypothetical protein
MMALVMTDECRNRTRERTMTEQPYTHEEIEAFTSKLEAWEATLSPREANLLRALVVQAPATDDEVEGFGFGMLAEEIKVTYTPMRSFNFDQSTPKLAQSALSPLAGDEFFPKVE